MNLLLKKNMWSFGAPAARLIAWSALLALGYSLAPLYESNQHQKFLHGLARAGVGFLDWDWLAGTTDPTPAFSALVYGTQRIGIKSLFYIYQVILASAYFAGLESLVRCQSRRPGTFSLFAIMAVVLHSQLLSDLSRHHLGVDLRAFFGDGLARQKVLGAYFQPNVFGVFLILSIAKFVEGKTAKAVILAAIAPAVHFTYFHCATTLVAVYLTHEFARTRRWPTIPAMIYLAIVAPTLIYTLKTFGPTSKNSFRFAHELLVHFRIPQHCVIQEWPTNESILKIYLVVLAIFLSRGTRLYAVMVGSSTVAAVLSLAQWITASDTLALLFPWRPSVYLVPIATFVVVGRLVERASNMPELLPGRLSGIARAVPLLLALNIAVYGAAQSRALLEWRRDGAAGRLMAHVRERSERGQMYLAPVGDRNDELQAFRLTTGVPLYVDFKSHPYKDCEVIEWYSRISKCNNIYNLIYDYSKIISNLRSMGITHLIISASQRRVTHFPRVEYANEGYLVVAVADLLSKDVREASATRGPDAGAAD